MRDADVRRVLLLRLEATHGAEKGALVVEELGLCGGRVRADVAVVNGALKGYEIKSDRDTLGRLSEQASIYSRIFDTVTLIVAARHLSTAGSIVPPWWGIEAAVNNAPSAVTLEIVRQEGINSSVDPHSLVKLLWREEALAILQDVDHPKEIRNKPRKILWEYLVNALSLAELKAAVRQSLKNRIGWQVVVPQRLAARV